jgi:hypothetical protein
VAIAARMINVIIFFMICGCLRFDKSRKDSKMHSNVQDIVFRRGNMTVRREIRHEVIKI